MVGLVHRFGDDLVTAVGAAQSPLHASQGVHIYLLHAMITLMWLLRLCCPVMIASASIQSGGRLQSVHAGRRCVMMYCVNSWNMISVFACLFMNDDNNILFRVAIRLDIHLKKLLQGASVTKLSVVNMNRLWAHS